MRVERKLVNPPGLGLVRQSRLHRQQKRLFRGNCTVRGNAEDGRHTAEDSNGLAVAVADPEDNGSYRGLGHKASIEGTWGWSAQWRDL